MDDQETTSAPPQCDSCARVSWKRHYIESQWLCPLCFRVWLDEGHWERPTLDGDDGQRLKETVRLLKEQARASLLERARPPLTPIERPAPEPRDAHGGQT